MIEKLMSLNHFTYKKPFSGSDKGNRFRYIIRMIEEEVETKEPGQDSGEEVKPEKVRRFQVTCWEGSMNSKVTPDENKKIRKFEFSENGYEELLKWLNEESENVI